MAYYHARANVCRVGVTYAGLVNRPLTFTVGGINRRADLLEQGFSVAWSLDGGSSTATFSVIGDEPLEFADVVLAQGGELWWGGTVLSLQRAVYTLQDNATVITNVQAVDWTWLMDRYARVSGVFGGSINTIVARLLADYTDGGFSAGWVPASLGAIDALQFDGDTVSEALARIAKAANNGAGAYVRIRPDKRVDLFASLDIEGNALEIETGADAWDWRWSESAASVRTRAIYLGASSPTTAAAAPGATTVAVAECAPFATGGAASAAAQGRLFTYTGTSVAVGPGSLTGCSAIVTHIPQGVDVSVAEQADDTAAQADMATLLGGGRSGVAVAWFREAGRSRAELAERAAADVALFSRPIEAIDYTTRMAETKIGKVVTVNIVSPFAIDRTFLIQRVSAAPIGAIRPDVDAGVTWAYRVEGRQVRRPDIGELLRGAQ